MSLKTDYKDYELAPSMGGQRHYRVTENADGTQSLTDVSEYLEIGDSFKAEDINATNSAVNDLANTPNDVTDLKMLGYTIPKEMPVKNYTDSNGVYHQRVGRIGLWEGNWYYDYDGSVFYASNIIGTKNGADFICKGYSNCGYIAVNSMPNMSIQIRTNGIYLKNTSYTDISSLKNAMKQQGVYLYYELATEITKSVDGNEVIDNVKLKYKDVNIGTVTINQYGYADVGQFIPSNIIVVGALIQTFGGSTKHAPFNITATGIYMMGAENDVISNVVIRYYYF